MMIGELAARSGLALSRIRFYEANGLLVGTRRRGNGYREFDPRTLQILEIIRCAQRAGWDHDGMPAALRRKIAEIEMLQRQLKKDKAQLRAGADLIENRPDDVDCVANSMRVLAVLRQ
jgi:DNA-binding transcriptional MerR regulator